MIYDASRVKVFHCSIGAIELTETEWGQLTLILQTSRPTNNAEVWVKSRTKDLRKRVSMGLTDRRKTAKNLVHSRKNWKISTVSRK